MATTTRGNEPSCSSSLLLVSEDPLVPEEEEEEVPPLAAAASVAAERNEEEPPQSQEEADFETLTGDALWNNNHSRSTNTSHAEDTDTTTTILSNPLDASVVWTQQTHPPSSAVETSTTADTHDNPETNQRVYCLVNELKRYLDWLPQAGAVWNAWLDEQYSGNDSLAQAAIQYYQQRPELVEYTLDKELPRMQYTWMSAAEGVVTDASHIALLLLQASWSDDPLMRVWARSANQSLWADLVQSLTTTSTTTSTTCGDPHEPPPPSLIRPHWHMAVHTHDVEWTLCPDTCTIVAKAVWELRLPHPQLQLVPIAQLTVSVQFSPQIPLVQYHVESMKPIRHDDLEDDDLWLLQVARFIVELPSFVVEEEEEDEEDELDHGSNRSRLGGGLYRRRFLQSSSSSLQRTWNHSRAAAHNLWRRARERELERQHNPPKQHQQPQPQHIDDDDEEEEVTWSESEPQQNDDPPTNTTNQPTATKQEEEEPDDLFRQPFLEQPQLPRLPSSSSSSWKRKKPLLVASRATHHLWRRAREAASPTPPPTLQDDDEEEEQVTWNWTGLKDPHPTTRANLPSRETKSKPVPLSSSSQSSSKPANQSTPTKTTEPSIPPRAHTARPSSAVTATTRTTVNSENDIPPPPPQRNDASSNACVVPPPPSPPPVAAPMNTNHNNQNHNNPKPKKRLTAAPLAATLRTTWKKQVVHRWNSATNATNTNLNHKPVPPRIAPRIPLAAKPQQQTQQQPDRTARPLAPGTPTRKPQPAQERPPLPPPKPQPLPQGTGSAAPTEQPRNDKSNPLTSQNRTRPPAPTPALSQPLHGPLRHTAKEGSGGGPSKHWNALLRSRWNRVVAAPPKPPPNPSRLGGWKQRALSKQTVKSQVTVEDEGASEEWIFLSSSSSQSSKKASIATSPALSRTAAPPHEEEDGQSVAATEESSSVTTATSCEASDGLPRVDSNHHHDRSTTPLSSSSNSIPVNVWADSSSSLTAESSTNNHSSSWRSSKPNHARTRMLLKLMA